MVFHGTGFPGSKRTKIGRPVRRANSNAAHEDHQEAAENPAPAVAPVDPPPPRPKKQRPDNNWRVARAVRSRDRTLERRASETAHLSQKIDSLQKSLRNQKAAVKVLTKTQHVQAKEHRVASLNLEEAHKRAIAELLEEHASAIDKAFATADMKTEELLMLEQQRLEDEAGYTGRIREERRLATKKLEKERANHKATTSASHARWIKNMAENMKAVDAQHKKDTTKLEKKLVRTKTSLEKERTVNQAR